VHGTPEEKKIKVLLETLNALGIAAELPQDVRPRDFRAITDRLQHDEQRPFIESLIVRSMQQAVYQPQNIGHFGLALNHYAHFTSPIRRYPDIVVHRATCALAALGEDALKARELPELAARCSALLVYAPDSDRERPQCCRPIDGPP
jgi:ribonuclease R